MSFDSWHRSKGFVTFAVLASAACSGSPEQAGEPTATKAEAVFGDLPQHIGADTYTRASDSTPEVNYGAYVAECDRHDGVDIDRSDNASTPCSVGWTTSGEWVEYEVFTSSSRHVNISARVASDLADRHLHISLDGQSLGDRVLPTTGSWLYTNITYPAVMLSSGLHTLRVTFDSDSINLNYLDVTELASPVEVLLPAVNAVASSLEYPVLSAALAIDSDPTTRWSSQFSDPQWIYLDLGEPRRVSRVRLSWETAASKSYEIAVSASSEGPWSVVAANTAGDGGVDELTFPPVSARYVRMYSRERTTQYGNSLFDFSVFGDAIDQSCTSVGSPPLFPAPQIVVPNIPLEKPITSLLRPQPTLEPSFIPASPSDNVCVFSCFNGSVLNGNTLLANGAVNGNVYVYQRDGSGTWNLTAELSNPEQPPPEGPVSDRDESFGAHSALLGDELLLSGTTNGVGKVYVFRRSGSSWSVSQTLQVNAVSLALAANSALIGTAERDVRVFEKLPNGIYRLQTVFNTPPNIDGSFGNSLAFDGTVALVGAPVNYNSGYGMGTAYAYERCESGFRLAQKFSPFDNSVSSQFAIDLALSDGQIAIGAPTSGAADETRTGTVELYDRWGAFWRRSHVIGNPIPHDGQYRRFGGALDLQAHRLLVGYTTAYPYPPNSYVLTFDVTAGPDFLVALQTFDSRSVQLSGSQALVDVVGWRYGTIPSVFDLSNFGTAGKR